MFLNKHKLNLFPLSLQSVRIDALNIVRGQSLSEKLLNGAFPVDQGAIAVKGDGFWKSNHEDTSLRCRNNEVYYAFSTAIKFLLNKPPDTVILQHTNQTRWVYCLFYLWPEQFTIGVGMQAPISPIPITPDLDKPPLA